MSATSTLIDARGGAGFWRMVGAYIALTKPRIIELLLVTTFPAMVVAADGIPSLWLIAATLVGGSLAAGGANTINCYLDRDIDAIMGRTHGRPIPAGLISPANALAFGITLSIISFVFLTLTVNLLTASLAVSGILFYVFIYTLWLKRTTVENIVIGGAAGAAPPVLGWTAVTGSVDPHALLLFLIIFAWTPPHFWALAIYRREDYANADIPMLPITHGVEYTRGQILLYSLILAIATLLPFATYMSGMVYLVGALVLDAGFLYYAVRMQFDSDDMLALRAFKYSIVYLAGLFFFFFLDHYWAALLRLLGIA